MRLISSVHMRSYRPQSLRVCGPAARWASVPVVARMFIGPAHVHGCRALMPAAQQRVPPGLVLAQAAYKARRRPHRAQFPSTVSPLFHCLRFLHCLRFPTRLASALRAAAPLAEYSSFAQRGGIGEGLRSAADVSRDNLEEQRAWGEPGLALTRGPGPLLPDPARYPEAPCACGWPSLLTFPPSYWHIRHGRVSARRFLQLLNTVGSTQRLLERVFISCLVLRAPADGFVSRRPCLLPVSYLSGCSYLSCLFSVFWAASGGVGKLATSSGRRICRRGANLKIIKSKNRIP
jgi:hypothetical protein